MQPLGVDLAREDGAELVPRQPRHGVRLPQHVPEPLRDENEEPVARRVAEGVVDFLEVVQVEQDDAHHLPAPLGVGDLALQPLLEGDPVGQPGQGVVVRHEGEPLLRPFAVGHVPGDEQAFPFRERDHARLVVEGSPVAGERVLEALDLPAAPGRLRAPERLLRRRRGKHFLHHPSPRLGAGSLHPLAAARHEVQDRPVPADPEDQVRDRAHEGAGLFLAAGKVQEGAVGAQDVADTVPEDHPVDRLGGEIRDAHLVGPVDGAEIVQPRHHHDRDALPEGQLANLLDRGEAPHPRHHGVHQDEVRTEICECGDAFLAVRRVRDGVPRAPQGGLRYEAGPRVVVHDQDQRLLFRRDHHALPMASPLPASRIA